MKTPKTNRVLKDSVYRKDVFQLSETEQRYGKNVHLLSSPFHSRLLSRFCNPSCIQPEANRIVTELSQFLTQQAVNHLFPREIQKIRTRMRVLHPEAEFEAELLASDSRAIIVDLMRAGILPSQICFETLHSILSPKNIRQDHILINRSVDGEGHVNGAQLSGFKVGGSVTDAFVFIPDPMAATGGTLATALELYRTKLGRPKKFIALHFIVTPEYLNRMKAEAKSVEIFALRLDRGLSSQKVLNSKLGTHWKQERGLNENQYIVPGAGGIGEILNNAFEP